MDGEVDTGVAPSYFLHNQALPGRLSDVPSVARKRDLPSLNPSFHHAQQQHNHHWLMGSGLSLPGNSNSWNPKAWDWDSTRFTAKPSEIARQKVLSLENQDEPGVIRNSSCEEQRKNVGGSGKSPSLSKGPERDGENLALKLGGGAYAVEEHVGRPNKRVRSGSPGTAASYPMCQVDDCRADLSNAKDYHRRHKVCELHSKTAKALVGKQMQRFCQQCSRFHPLTEFDEGKRSCRRRLAGHNRRRRKTQPEDASSNPLVPGSQDGKATGSMDIVNLLAILARLQGNIAGKTTTSMASLPDRDQLVQILNKIGSLPPADVSLKTHVQSGFDLNVSQAPQQVSQVLQQISQTPQQSSSKMPSQESGNPSAPSTMNLLAVLSAALASSNPDTLASLSPESSDGSGNSKSTGACRDAIADINSQSKLAHISPPFGGGEAGFNVHSQSNSSEHWVKVAMPSISLQLFGSAEDDSSPKLGSASKYPSSESSNPIEDRSPSHSPPIAKRFFPLHSPFEKKDESMPICREDLATAEASTSCGWARPPDLFKVQDRQLENQTVQNLPYPGRYSSSSGSDVSPSISNCGVQDRTGRIVFKLFDKDPSNLPVTLRTEILNWLSHSPSEIESYIRPGCVVLSVYLCMTLTAWDELEEDLYQRISSLVSCSDSGFWENGRFLVRTTRQLASLKDGKIRVCKSWRTLSAPELTSVSPIAVVRGQETTLVLRGRNLTVPGTTIHCTYYGGYSSKEVLGSAHPGTIYDDSSSETFILPNESYYSYGRYFIEVDNGFKGNSFPIIVADATICQELRSLESEFDEDVDTTLDAISQGCPENGRLQSREDVLHFLNELGWLFQRKIDPDSFVDFSTSRFKYLFIFSVERDLPALVRTLLDILVERGYASNSILHEYLELHLELQLLDRAVKKKCSKVVELLLNYSARNAITKDSRVYIFPPNSTGPGGLTPLHLAASMQDAEDMVDALTNDPQEIGLNCWASVLDDSGQSPFMYASSRNNHSYNMLVSRKVADKKNGQVSIMMGNEEISLDKSWIESDSPAKHGISCIPASMGVSSCARCATAESQLVQMHRGRGLLQRPYIHSMLAIAAVCVCVCLLFRGAPWVGSVAPFKWENLDCGPR